MCKFQTYMHNIIQSKLAHLPLSHSEVGNILPAILFLSHAGFVSNSSPVYLITPSENFVFGHGFGPRGSSAPLSWSETRIFLRSRQTLPSLSEHHFILINVNLIRWLVWRLLYLPSDILDVLGIDLLRIYSTSTVQIKLLLNHLCGEGLVSVKWQC